MISADTLVLLSDIDGLYTADPRKDKSATHIAEITEMTAEIEAMAGEAPHRLFLRRHGDQARGRAHRDERRLPHGDRRRPPHESAAGDPRRRHLHLVPAGLRAEDRAQALDRRLAEAGRHAGGRCRRAGRAEVRPLLLPAGITAVEGKFERGDAVIVADAEGNEVARGLVAYSARDARHIMGHKSREIADLLGYRGRDEMIHRDDLVLS